VTTRPSEALLMSRWSCFNCLQGPTCMAGGMVNWEAGACSDCKPSHLMSTRR
jgi:hypothetical protein